MRKPLVRLSALALAFAIATAGAQDIQTSGGLRTLPLTSGYTNEAQYLQAARMAESVIRELMQDLDATEATLRSVGGSVSGLNEKVRSENAEYERAKATFDQADRKYLSDLAAFQQQQTSLEAEVMQQRNQAAALAARPEADRSPAEITRLNDWATRLSNQRTALESERARLLAEHARVEAERVKLEKQRRDAEARLLGQRDQTVQTATSSQQKRAEGYRQLKVAIDYLRRTRAQAARIGKNTPPRSDTLELAEARLTRYKAEPGR